MLICLCVCNLGSVGICKKPGPEEGPDQVWVRAGPDIGCLGDKSHRKAGGKKKRDGQA